MEKVIDSGRFKPAEVRTINYCRLWLDVHTISDITDEKGRFILQGYREGNRPRQFRSSKDLPCIQSKPETKLAWATWRKALKLWSTNSGRLYRPLGKWRQPSHQLRQQFPFHYHSPTQTTYVTQEDGYVACPVNPNSPNGTIFDHDTESVVEDLPEGCFPTEGSICTMGVHVSTEARSKATGTDSIQSQTPPPNTFNDYISTLPEWERDILQHVECKLDSHLEVLYAVLDSSTPASPNTVPSGILGVSDGSELAGQGTFGWALSLANETILAQCAGRAYGDKMDSYRAEGYGHLSILCYVSHLFRYYNVPIPQALALQFFSDNIALVKKVHQWATRTRPVFPNCTLMPSYDLVQACATKVKELSGAKVRWVKGHRDLEVEAHEMLPQERLNIVADRLAGDFQSTSNHKHKPAPMIAGAMAQVRVRQRTIHSHCRRQVRQCRGATALRSRILRKTGMPIGAFMDIDWETHRMCCRNYDGSKKFLSQLLHGYLPVGKVIHRYNKVKYLQECPSCDEPVEDQVHWLKCPDPTRQQWQATLRAALRKQWHPTSDAPCLIDILDDGLHHWFNDTPFPAEKYPDKYQELIMRQGQIGWGQLLYGRFSSQWSKCQVRFRQEMGLAESSRSHGPTWLMQFIRIIWNHVHQEWITRNKAKNGEDSETRTAANLARIKRQIEHLYTFKDKCLPRHRRVYFYESVERHFEKHTRYPELDQWVQAYQRSIYKSSQTYATNNEAGQQLIDQFLQGASD